MWLMPRRTLTSPMPLVPLVPLVPLIPRPWVWLIPDASILHTPQGGAQGRGWAARALTS